MSLCARRQYCEIERQRMTFVKFLSLNNVLKKFYGQFSLKISEFRTHNTCVIPVS